jgi:hypothetical protein
MKIKIQIKSKIIKLKYAFIPIVILFLCVFLLLRNVFFCKLKYSYCYICSVPSFMSHCVVLCVYCAALLPPDFNPIAVKNKYIKNI